MTDELPVLAELERRLLAACYAPQRQRARAWSWAAVGVVASCCAIVVALLVGSGSVAPPAAAALADAAAAVERGPALAPLRPGQFWYARTVVSARAPLPIVPRTPPVGKRPTVPPLVWFISRQSIETWIGIDGTLRMRTIELSRRFATPADRARWLAAGQQLPASTATDSITAGDSWFPPQLASAGPDAGDGLFSYTQLLSLPTGLPALRQRLEQAQAAFQKRVSTAFTKSSQNLGNCRCTTVTFQFSGGSQVYTSKQTRAITQLKTIAELLSTPLPTAVRAALFRLAATIPGVNYRGRVHDPLGRPGVAVSVGAGAHEVRLIFDPRRGVLLADIEDGGLASTIVTQGVVGSIDALPAGVRAVPGPAGLRPQTIAISPRVGVPATTFTLTLAAHLPASRPGQPSAFIFFLSGPAGARCQSSVPQPLISPARQRTTASTRQTLATYLITPSEARRRAWCPGRYQLRVDHFAAGSSSGLGSDAVYFQVR
jgi:hypothetical protein